MAKKEMIRLNPLRLMGYAADDILPKGGFGAVMARAGVGKTAFLVQLALDKLLRERNVLHVSLDEPVDKICLWYEEVFRNASLFCGMKGTDALWETVLPHRFIMTFRIDGFSVPKLEERVADLTEQAIFFPQLLLMDGFPFETADRDSLKALKAFAESIGIAIWFTVRTHRHESSGPGGIPAMMSEKWDLFDVVIELKPEGKDIYVEAVKGAPPAACETRLVLDPATMLVRDKQAAIA